MYTGHLEEIEHFYLYAHYVQSRSHFFDATLSVFFSHVLGVCSGGVIMLLSCI